MSRLARLLSLEFRIDIKPDAPNCATPPEPAPDCLGGTVTAGSLARVNPLHIARDMAAVLPRALTRQGGFRLLISNPRVP
jgi:hypothetical protein